MPISVEDTARLRAPQHTVDLALDAVPLVPLASAQINQATFAYPLAQITVDNTSDNWLTASMVGRAYSVGASVGSESILWGAVRKSPTSSLFYPNAFSAGDTGYARDIRQGVVNDAYVTVYHHRPLWSQYSRISNKVFYKQFDVAYTDQGSSPAPVCNIGQHRFAYVDAGASTELAFDALQSFAWGSKTLAGYLWTVETVSGGTAAITGGDDSYSTTIEFPAGVYVVSCRLTDSGSKTHTAFRYVFVRERSGVHAPFGASCRWQITSDTQDGVGRRVGLKLYGQFAPEAIYPGQMFMLYETARFGGEALYDDTQRVSNFVGYVAGYTTDRSLTTPSIELTLESPLHYVKQLGAASQYLQERTSPANWTQCTSALSNAPGALWYILQHHAPTVLAAHDYRFDSAIKQLRRRVFEFPAASIGGQVEKLGDYGLGAIGCRSDGTLVFKRHAAYMDNTERNALDNKFTWNEGDIIPPLSIPFSYTLPVNVVNGGAFSYGGGSQATPYASRAPGAVAAQGVSQPEFTFTVTPAQGQAQVNIVTGHRFAYEAPKTQNFSFTADRNLDIAEPCDVDVWHTINIPAAYDPKGDGQMNLRHWPVRVQRGWKTNERGALVKSVSVEWKRETFGQPGITVPIPRGEAAAQIKEGVIQNVVIYDPAIADSFAVGWNTAGALVRSNNFNTQTPHYESLTDGITGTVCDFTPDYGSEFFVFGVGSLGGWVVSVSGTSLYVWYSSNIRTGAPIWMLQETYTMADSTVTNSARIASSKTTVGLCLVAWRCRNGTRVGRTTDGGTNWSSIITVGETSSDTDNDNADIGLAVDGVNQLVTARYTDNDYYLYLATSTGGSFSRVSASPASAAPYPLITVDGEGRCYVRTTSEEHISVELFNETVTFDSGGFAFALTNMTTTTTEAYSGYSAKSPNFTGNNGSGKVEIDTGITVPDGDAYTVIISFYYKIDWIVPTSSTVTIFPGAEEGQEIVHVLSSSGGIKNAWQYVEREFPNALGSLNDEGVNWAINAAGGAFVNLMLDNINVRVMS